MDKPILVGLTGRKRAGKDTAADPLIAAGFQPLTFAGPIKIMIGTLLECQGVEPDIIERMLHGDLKEEPTAFLGGQTPRHAMQTLGTQWGRDQMGKGFWRDIGINRAQGMMGEGDSVVITDVRFPNELEAIQALDGKVIRIERPDRPSDPVTDAHESERYIDGLDVNITIENCSTIETLQAIVVGFVDQKMLNVQ